MSTQEHFSKMKPGLMGSQRYFYVKACMNQEMSCCEERPASFLSPLNKFFKMKLTSPRCR